MNAPPGFTGHARCVAADVRHRFEALPADSELHPLTKAVLEESVNRLSTGPATTVARIQNRARLIQALYRALDRLDAAQRPTAGHLTVPTALSRGQLPRLQVSGPSALAGAAPG